MDFQEPEEQYEDLLCRLCEQQGEFELSENEFEYENNEVTLLTAFNTFSSLDNVSKTFRMQRIRNCQLKLFFFLSLFNHKNDSAVYLCQKCTDQLIEAYKFTQQVKLSDQNVLSKLLHIEADVDEAQTDVKCDKLDAMVELLETDDELEAAQITLKRGRKTRKSNETATKRIRTESSPKKSIHSDSISLPINFALAQYVITSNALDEVDDRFDENATNPLELDSNLLADDVDGQTSKNDNEPSPTRNRVKTLKTSAIVATSLQEIGDLCAITIDGDHDSQSIYQCKYCPKAFAGPYHLMVHTRKSHQCQYCLSAFVKVTDLYKHVKETHNSFDCLLCGRIFRTNGNLRQHMRKNHDVFLPAHVSLLNASEAHNNDDIDEMAPNHL